MDAMITRMLTFWYPYATKMDAVVTRMLTFCVSVCYKNGCSGYTEVNILRIRMLQKMDAVVTRMLTFCVSVCYKNGCSGCNRVPCQASFCFSQTKTCSAVSTEPSLKLARDVSTHFQPPASTNQLGQSSIGRHSRGSFLGRF